MKNLLELIIPLFLLSLHIYSDFQIRNYYKIYMKLVIILLLSIFSYAFGIKDWATFISFIGFFIYVSVSYIDEIFRYSYTFQSYRKSKSEETIEL